MISTTIKNNILKAMVGQVDTISIAPTCYIGLSTTDPGVNGANFTEPDSEYGYQRYQLGNKDNPGNNHMSAPSNGQTSNVDILYFPEVTGTVGATPWGTIGWFGLFSGKTTGTPFAWGRLTDGDPTDPQPTTITPVVGQLPIIRVGSLVLKFDD